MNKVESLHIKYVGYSNPKDKDEIELECLGLKTVIAAAKQRIAVLSQSLMLNHMMKEHADEKTVPETSEETEKTK